MGAFDEVFAALVERQLLMQQDQQLPSVVGIITGGSLSTSWWSHPKAQVVFDTLSRLADHPDVLFSKLIEEKVTLVHRALWPALLAVVSSGAAWQTDGLSPEASTLLASLAGGKHLVAKSASKELERRLLANASEVHTASGKHEMRLEAWADWAQRVSCAPLPTETEGKSILEAAARAIGAKPTALPWQRMRNKARTLKSAR